MNHETDLQLHLSQTHSSMVAFLAAMLVALLMSVVLIGAIAIHRSSARHASISFAAGHHCGGGQTL